MGEAVELCSSHGYRLCSWDEFNQTNQTNNQMDSSGCELDDEHSWTSSEGATIECTVFASKNSKCATDSEKENFMDHCASEAFLDDGTLKAEYQCTGDDAKYAAASVLGF